MLSWYPTWEYPIAATQLVLTMLGVGVTLEARDFLTLVKDPRGFSAGLVAQLLFAPAAALGFVYAFGTEPGLAMGLFLLAAVPGGTLSNVYTWLAKGNVALSIALTAVLSLAALVTTPLILELTAGRDDFVLPVGRILFDICVILLLPLGLGMLLGPRLGARRERFAKYAIRAGLALVALIVVGALGSGRLQIDAFGWSGPLLIIGFCLTLLWGSRLIAWLMGTGVEDRVAVTVETTVRNTNFGVLLAVSLFPATTAGAGSVGGGALFAVLFYGGTALVTGLILALVSRYRYGRRAAAKTEPQVPV